MSEPKESRLDPNEIAVLRERIAPQMLARLLAANYVHTVKFVADLGQERIAIGGIMHADAEAVLLEAGSAQSELWGGNYRPGREVWLEYTSFINIRPSHGNPSMEVQDPELRARIRELVERLVGSGASL